MTENHSRAGYSEDTQHHPPRALQERQQQEQQERQQQQHLGAAALVTVVIPCYNQAHFLEEAIESVLAQSHPNFEIIVIDDGSTDDTSEVAERYPGVRLFRQDNQGLAAARNAGLWRSKGEYLVFLDADDRLLPWALEVGLKHLNAHPECAFVSGYYRPIAVDGSPLSLPQQQHRTEKDHYLELLREGPSWPPVTVMFRRSVFESVGGFDASLRAAEDYDMYLRIARRWPINRHDEVVAQYRVHSASLNHNAALMLKSTLAVLRPQWKHVKGNKQYEEALKRGIRVGQDHYGSRLAYKVLAHARRWEWKQAVGDLLALLRYHPRVPVRACQKLASRMRGCNRL